MIVFVDDESFHKEIIESSIPAALVLWADWSGPCHIIEPIIEDLAGEYKGLVKIGKLEIEKNPQTSKMLGIPSPPTIFFFIKGQVVDHIFGAVPKREIEDILKSIIHKETS